MMTGPSQSLLPIWGSNSQPSITVRWPFHIGRCGWPRSASWIKQQMGTRFRTELDRFFADNLFNMTNQPDIHVPYLLA